MSNTDRDEIVNRLAQICGNIESYSSVFVIACQKEKNEDGTKLVFFGNADTINSIELYGISNLFSKLMDAYIYRNTELLEQEEQEDESDDDE